MTANKYNRYTVNCKHEKGNKRGNDIIYLSLYQQYIQVIYLNV